MSPLLWSLSVLVFCQGALSDIQLLQSGSGTVPPGQSLTLTCAVTGESVSDGAYFHWVRQPPGKGLEWMGTIDWLISGWRTNYASSLQGRITISPDTSANSISLQLSSLTAADCATYYCVRKYSSPFENWGQGTLVTVTSATATAPAVFPLSPCCHDTSSASQVTMGCLISGYFPEPATVQWNSGDITTGIQNFPSVLQTSSGHYIFSSQLTIPSSSWQSKTFQCNVAHAATSSKINKEIEACSSLGPVTPEVHLLHSSCSRKTDLATVQLVCLISSFYPSTITVNWLVDGQRGVLASSTEIPRKDATGDTFSTTSTANISQVDWKEGKTYTCQVTHEGVTVEKHASKCPGASSDCTTSGVKISVLPPTPADLYMNGDPKLVCLISNLDSDVGLKVNWSWEKPGPLNPEELEITSESDGTFTARSSLIISKQNWLAGDVYTCQAEHPSFAAPLTMPIAKKTGKHSHPHVYLFRPHNEELKSREPNVSITCLVKGFAPEEISIKWLENHNVVSESAYVTTPVQMDSSQQAYFIYSMMTVSKADWNNGSSYTCHVVHEGLSMKYTQRTIEKIQGKK